MDSLYLKDLNSIISCDLPWEKLKNKNVLVTGATGLIGSCIVDALVKLEFVNVFAMGRNEIKGKERFKDYWEKTNFNFICHDVSNKLELEVEFDYIIHAASGSHPFEFNNYPVETMVGNFIGVYNLLEYGKLHKLKRFLYVSSGEVYGENLNKSDGFKEDDSGYVNPIKLRSCYPSSKRAAETLLVSYGAEYGIDSVILRPCHIFGPTMTKEDSRAVSEFIRNAVNDEDIVLTGSGKQIRSYCYVTDLVSSLFYVLFLGERNEAYNVSGNDLVSIKELANIISEYSDSKVIVNEKVNDKVIKIVLNDEKLEKLGWKCKVELREGIKKTIDILKREKDAE